MRKLAFLLGAVLALAGGSVRADELQRVELDIGPQNCDNWQSFPSKSWTNNTGAPIRIKKIEAKFASASSLVSELSIWLSSALRGGLTLPGIIYSYGMETYTNPSVWHPDRFDAGADWITIQAGDVLTATLNCGPVNGGPASINYVGVLIFYYTAAP